MRICRSRCITARSMSASAAASRRPWRKAGSRAVVCTSTLDLGIDWGDVDLVINVGAPKGASRLMQRIGRANHRLDEPSRAVLVPSNRFEVLECRAAVDAVYAGDAGYRRRAPRRARRALPAYSGHGLRRAVRGGRSLSRGRFPLSPIAMLHAGGIRRRDRFRRAWRLCALIL